ncbi:hypothetical protein H6G96_30560 [Nostoc sp. FACHB-892]|uniref:hypothetical protein n=1 Tax=Nostoc sp. FACHB-892 TaxID=2692843 RepID=UPI001688BD47|nr:hypothetical protein [Nostoc sp. FACHB-892]MBD2730542.1 hypothetical protein [Nostoc sp. FACHB-892]
MESGWRKQLFNQKQSQSGVNPLVLPMSKAKAAKIIGICPRTLERWAKVASLIPEYRLILIRMQALAQEKNLRAAPITSYQVWVIAKIGELFGDITQGIDKKALVEAIVEANKVQYTRAQFEQEQLGFTEEAEGKGAGGRESKSSPKLCVEHSGT